MRLGKAPARPGAVTFKLSAYLDTTVLPTPPRVIGHANLLPRDVGVLGNDSYGDCVFAGAAHETMLWNLEAGRTVPFTDHAVLSDYSAVTGFNPADPNTDQGTDMAVAASYRRKTGIVDAAGTRHKVGAYLAITPGNTTELALALYLFGAVGIGIKFPASAMEQFNAGKSWHVVSGSPIEGGHYVPVVSRNGSFYVLTWGRLQKVTLGFLRKYMDEAMCYVSEERLTNGVSLDGFNAAQLLADLHALK